jgi:DNA-binding LacI/PurR family transcriptional regulator
MLGVRSAVEEARRQLEIRLRGDFTIGSGRTLGLELLSVKDRPTALACYTDQVAIGAVRAARELRPRGARRRVRDGLRRHRGRVVTRRLRTTIA